MSACVAQEELQSIGRRLLDDRWRRRGGLRLRLLLGDLDAPLVERSVDGVDLRCVQPQHFHRLG